MASFHVYVEGADDPSPEGLRKLASAISQRYGLPSADLLARLSSGRFRVKANVDKVTAEAYVRALEEVGARVVIEEANARAQSDVSGRTSSSSVAPMNLRGSTTPPPRAQPSVPPSNQRSGAQSLPPANAPRPSSSALPQRNSAQSLPPENARPTPTSSPLQSGLSAAFSTRAPSESEFGALGGGALSLSSLDGNDEGTSSNQFAPPSVEPAAAAPVATAPAAKSRPTAKPAADAAQPLDLFAPPDAEEADALVELAADEIEHRARKMSTPPAGVPVNAATSAQSTPIPLNTPNTPAMRRSNPSIQPPTVPARIEAETPRARFAAGVALSIVLGFIPAHLIAASREQSADASIDRVVVATQNDVDDEEAYKALDGFRAAQLDKKKSAHRSIAWQSMLIWAAAGAGIAYVFFRRIPWPTPNADS